MRNILLTIAYDGTEYCGWQEQLNGISVAAKINGAIESLTGKRSKLYGSGRTDSGVHALAQKANFKTEFSGDCDRITAGLNFYLPEDIRVLSCAEVSEDFNARFNAKSKTYIYKIYNSPILSPFYINRAWHIKYPLNVGAMRRAAWEMEGERDFTSFMASGSPVKSAVRNLSRLSVSRSAEIIEVSATANGFLYNMVRIIVGTLVYTGMGKLTPEDIKPILQAQNRAAAAPTAPARGLYLKEVVYG